MRYWEVEIDAQRVPPKFDPCEVITYSSAYLSRHVALVRCTEHGAALLRGRLGVFSIVPAADGPYRDDSGRQYELSGNGTILTEL
jgi:hypothetical protein